MIIGCPYSERNCKQNLYAAFVFYVKKTSSKHLIFALTDSISLSGFSGAPVVDMNGFVVGILCGGGSESGDHFIYLHSINFLKSIADNKE